MDLGAQCNLMVAVPSLPTPVQVLAALAHATSGAIVLGQKDLVSEADGFMKPADFEENSDSLLWREGPIT